MPSRLSLAFLAVVLTCSLTGCAVITVAAVAVDVTTTAAGLAVDAAVGTAKAVGWAAGAVIPDSDEKK